MKVPVIILILFLFASCDTTKKVAAKPVKPAVVTTSKSSKGGLAEAASYMDQQILRIRHDVHGAKVEKTINGFNITYDDSGNGENQQFNPGTSALTFKGRESLDNLIKVFHDFPDTWLRIESFTDNNGPDGLNMALSQRRAYAVANYLKQKKISPHRLMVRWYGETRAKVKNVSAVARAENRRIEIVVTSSSEKRQH